MTLIDAVDKVFEDTDLGGRFRDSYEWLSEFCHPNLFSRMALGHELKGREIVFPETPQTSEEDVRNALGPGNLSQSIFFHCYSGIADLIGGVPPVGGRPKGES